MQACRLRASHHHAHPPRGTRAFGYLGTDTEFVHATQSNSNTPPFEHLPLNTNTPPFESNHMPHCIAH